ncbi:N-acetylglucosamine kinase [Kineococcus rhizosphaerae]|uniref:N-acetylglucosamine kinase-like BadF-type ATPase n=1 Tax=Kineococcus rhizosphaerae TaxID=559628 RepID=A0A2T0R1H4_9ACTN|nr:BadF/BadG/BcrA/BcrD ATPase family protein [Kineococcus rhizosphaerae]PRY13360.1 N-acetylglucosamine kinase-like BadF-type ATPase [Kineococcus rhizosphaerae]
MSPDGVVLAVDAGGSTTRALVLDASGEPLARAVAGPGNPTAVGVRAALAALHDAVCAALAEAGRAAAQVVSAVVASAGSDRLVSAEHLTGHLGLAPGVPFRRVPDLLAMYFSATDSDAGAGLIAGTGSVAARVGDGALERVVGGTGWLLGDGGSGFWIGRRVVRAVAAELDGTGAATSLTPAVLADLGLADDRRPREGRPFVLGELVDTAYGAEPVRLARLAPVCFAAAGAGDAVAAGVVAAAQDELAVLVRAVAGPGPLVVGGSVWRRGVEGSLAPGGALRGALAGRDVRPADDGLLGAAVLALRALGRPTLRLRAAAGPPARP